MSDWQDRRGMFQRGKELHEPARKTSGAGVTDAVRRASIGSNSDMTKTTTNESTKSPRRTSGAAFEGLTALKRGSQDYGERRASHSEMHGSGGVVAGWFNKTFRGMEGSKPAPAAQKTEPKRGVMDWYEHRTDAI